MTTYTILTSWQERKADFGNRSYYIRQHYKHRYLVASVQYGKYASEKWECWFPVRGTRSSYDMMGTYHTVLEAKVALDEFLRDRDYRFIEDPVIGLLL